MLIGEDMLISRSSFLIGSPSFVRSAADVLIELFKLCPGKLRFIFEHGFSFKFLEIGHCVVVYCLSPMA